eukprot:scaffold79479_cov25-Prasinocladus_malaysianus.AAC.2
MEINGAAIIPYIPIQRRNNMTLACAMCNSGRCLRLDIKPKHLRNSSQMSSRRGRSAIALEKGQSN